MSEYCNVLSCRLGHICFLSLLVLLIPPRTLSAATNISYDSGGKYPFKFTTEVNVVPDVLPFSFKTHARSSWKERQNFLQANIIPPYETYSSEGLAAR